MPILDSKLQQSVEDYFNEGRRTGKKKKGDFFPSIRSTTPDGTVHTPSHVTSRRFDLMPLPFRGKPSDAHHLTQDAARVLGIKDPIDVRTTTEDLAGKKKGIPFVSRRYVVPTMTDSTDPRRPNNMPISLRKEFERKNNQVKGVNRINLSGTTGDISDTGRSPFNRLFAGDVDQRAAKNTIRKLRDTGIVNDRRGVRPDMLLHEVGHAKDFDSSRALGGARRRLYSALGGRIGPGGSLAAGAAASLGLKALSDKSDKVNLTPEELTLAGGGAATGASLLAGPLGQELRAERFGNKAAKRLGLKGYKRARLPAALSYAALPALSLAGAGIASGASSMINGEPEEDIQMVQDAERSTDYNVQDKLREYRQSKDNTKKGMLGSLGLSAAALLALRRGKGVKSIGRSPLGITGGLGALGLTGGLGSAGTMAYLGSKEQNAKENLRESLGRDKKETGGIASLLRGE